MKAKYLTLKERVAYRSLEDVLGCKWSVAVVAAIGQGIHRPGELERFIPGISTKVLTERLRRLVDYRMVSRTEHPGNVLRVEYRLTPPGEKLASIIRQVRELGAEHERPA